MNKDKLKNLEIANLNFQKRLNENFESSKKTIKDLQLLNKKATPGQTPQEINKEIEVTKLFKELAANNDVSKKTISQILYLMYNEAKTRKI